MEKENEVNPIFSQIHDYVATAAEEEFIKLTNSGMISKNDKDAYKKLEEKHEIEVFDWIQKEIEKIAAELNIFLDQLKEDDIDLYKKIKSAQLTPEQMKEKYKDCKTVEDFEKKGVSLSEEEIRKIDELGKKWFDLNEFEKALIYFHFQAIIDFSNVDNWVAKGIAEQNLGRYENAIQSYYMAAHLNPSYFLPYLLIVESLILNKKLEEARLLYFGLINEVNADEYKDNEFYLSKINTLNNILAKAA